MTCEILTRYSPPRLSSAAYLHVGVGALRVSHDESVGTAEAAKLEGLLHPEAAAERRLPRRLSLDLVLRGPVSAEGSAEGNWQGIAV